MKTIWSASDGRPSLSLQTQQHVPRWRVAAIICPSYEKLSQEQSDGTYLINELTMVEIVRNKHLEPQLRPATFDEITRLVFKHRVVVGDGDELVITKALGICDVRQIRVPGLAKLSDNQGL